MTIDKAIEILGLRIKSPFVRANPDTKDAIKLGIEALKRIKECRLADHTIKEDLLPGETES